MSEATVVFEIKDEKDYELAVGIRPDLAEITFDALRGHFFALNGEFQFATIPPGYLSDNGLCLIKGWREPLVLAKMVLEGVDKS